jgi:hypothetical protein
MWKIMTKADVQIERNSDVKTNFIPAKRGVSPGEFSGQAAGLIACRRRSISLPAFVFRKDEFDVINWEGTELMKIIFFCDVRP